MSLLKSDINAIQKGGKAPDFSLLNIDGRTINLNDFKDKILVIIFMCNHCPYVKPKIDEIASIQEDYTDKGVEVVCINSNDPDYDSEDSFDNMKFVASQKGYKYYLFDEIQDVARAYGAVCTPDPYVFDKQHRLVYHGRINDAMSPEDKANKHDLREVLDKLVVGKEIINWFEPSMGCSIKWRSE